MLRRFLPCALAVSLAASAAAQSPPPPPAGQPADPADTNRPRLVPGFDPAAMDRGANPCDDFYQFACGSWLKANPVPADRGRYGRFDELQERNQATLRDILEKAAAGGAARGAVDQKIGDYYAACMDEAAIGKKGVAALKPQLDAIAAISSPASLASTLARLHGDGVAALFQFGSQPDFKQASVNIAGIDQGGLGLPDRDYYVKDEPRFAEVRAQYPVHVQRMFELMGDAPEAAARHARTVLDIETALARASLERVKRRDPANRDHKMTRAQLAALAPGFAWDAYFTAAGAPAFADLNVGWPDFFKAMGEAVAARGLDEWKTYLRWHTVHDAAPLLPAAFVNENFAFYGQTLTGAKELRPRWKRCVDLADAHLGEALGQRYVEATFGAEGKQRMAVMVAALEKALERDIRDLPWMTDATRKRAQEKLAHIANKIGYPERWRDYSALRIDRGDALGNAARAEAFEEARDRAKIGRAVDPTEWRMTPPTVNAYYSSLENNINFPAGILQPPFFDRAMDDAVNFGGIGAVIGHELTHGFDDQGRKFDAKGNLSDWWTEQDAREFEKRASCIADQYSGYTVVGDVKLNGRLTLGENTADNGGLRIAYMALQESGRAAPPALRDGFTPEQRLFLAWGQIWCQNQTEETARLRAQTDPHSPGRYRVIGVVSNMPEFQKAFSCPAGSKMVRENMCRVW
ncbi:MAG TPA: M13 family metallopeptidase [Vicinamibacteria bacterium]|nr:M13 family metallopeptidase [Vicinamibacteria bacterium]